MKEGVIVNGNVGMEVEEEEKLKKRRKKCKMMNMVGLVGGDYLGVEQLNSLIELNR